MKVTTMDMDELRRLHSYGEMLVGRGSAEFGPVLGDAIETYAQAIAALEAHGLTALENSGLESDFTIPDEPRMGCEHVNTLINLEMFSGRVLDSGAVRGLAACLPSSRVGFYITMHHKFVEGGIEIVLLKDQCIVASRSVETQEFVFEMMTEMLADSLGQ